MKKGLALASLLLAGWLATVAASPAYGKGKEDDDDNNEYAPGELLVQFKPGATAQEKDDAHKRNGGRVKGEIEDIGVQIVEVDQGKERERKGGYKKESQVVFAEENGVYRVIGHPSNDPQVGSQWQYNNTGQTGGTADADVDAFEAWHTATPNGPVRIAILDTGIDLSHEDLKAKIVKSRNFTTSPSADDQYGHGTHVAGSAAAITGNGVGVAGTCPTCQLLNVKVLGDDGSGSWSWIASGIRWATNNHAQVINLSLGGSSSSSTVQSAINYAVSKGVVVVAAAGNSSTNAPSYPAFYPKVIAVAATDRKDALASFSNFGNWVDVAAPGVAILSTAPDHDNRIWGSGVKYGAISGTSMATPHVAGIAGLVLATGGCAISQNSAQNTCVRDRIEGPGRADDIPGTGTYWTYGRVNANNSVAP
jgi:thermitase